MKHLSHFLFVLILCALLLGGCACEHEWLEPDCITPKTCSKCHETEGEASGHNWAEATCSTPKTCTNCQATEGEALGHSWTEATCSTPKTCTNCQAAEGEALGHNWAEATCSTPKTCTNCQTTEGEALGHEVVEWNISSEATCQSEGLQNGTCQRCGYTLETPIEKLPHKEGEWVITTQATTTQSGIRQLSCSVCGNVIQEEAYVLTEEEKIALFKEECQKYTYDEVARNPDNYKGLQGYVRGEVIQVMEDGDDYILRVNMTKGKYTWKDTILVYYTRNSSTESRILEDDIVKMHGVWHGTYTYETVMGSSFDMLPL